MVFAPQVGVDNEKLADLLAGVAGHLCQVTCFNPSISFVKLCKELYNWKGRRGIIHLEVYYFTIT